MKFGEIVESFSIPPHPKGISIEGKLVDLKPLIASEFAEELFISNAIDKEGINWVIYLMALLTLRSTMQNG